MAVGDRYRAITPRDNLVFDADNNLVGVQSPIALGNTEMRLGAPLTAGQVAALQVLVSGDRIADAASRNISASDNGNFLAPTGAITYTIPAGLSPMPSFTVDCPVSGSVTVAVSGGATINGAAASLSRTRATNPVGFVVLAHEAGAYGVSGV